MRHLHGPSGAECDDPTEQIESALDYASHVLNLPFDQKVVRTRSSIESQFSKLSVAECGAHQEQVVSALCIRASARDPE
ncbi:unnamed protein product [Danaus chrysippus]|uniref:(African queen) hypothetical protein n=1 Tax=Danaus chrysippus TaxID=151541 RepID=A0A8J2VSR8_9NEOP|nr:unnamed protein product [Danaus chrysippus]